MRTVPAALKTFLETLRREDKVWRADLFTLTLQSGSVTYRWTTWDAPLIVGGYVYQPAGPTTGPQIARGPVKVADGLVVDTLDVELSGSFSVGGKTLQQLAAANYFAGARVVVDHLLMPSPGDTSLGAISKWFVGYVGPVNPHGVVVSMTLKSDLERLNVKLPRNRLQPQCNNIIYDANCGLLTADWTEGGSGTKNIVGDVVTRSYTSIMGTARSGTSGAWTGKVLRFLTGSCAGLSRTIASDDGNTLTYSTTSPKLPAAGDDYVVEAVSKTCLAVSGTTATVIKSTSPFVVLRRDTDYFNLGFLEFLTGSAAGLRRNVVSVVSTDGGNAVLITLAKSLGSVPSVGDSFSIRPGCDRSRDACANYFSNLVHYRGFPRMPRPESGA